MSTKKLLLDVPEDFIVMLDLLAENLQTKRLTESEWINNTNEGRTLMREIQYTNKYASRTRSTPDLNALIHEKYLEAHGNIMGRPRKHEARVKALHLAMQSMINENPELAVRKEKPKPFEEFTKEGLRAKLDGMRQRAAARKQEAA